MSRWRTKRNGLIVWLCAVGGACIGQSLVADPTTEVYARATNQFGAAIFFKPAQATNTDFACQLVPLILQEVPSWQATASPPGDPFGTVGFSNGVPALDPKRPAVYWTADSVWFNGTTHPRVSYQWWYCILQPSGHPTSLSRQGVRITLDSRGQPAVWEILADTSGLRLIFISQSLEKSAAAAFGKPLPGRRYSIEREVGQTPKVIVPRVVEDGQQAMGPIVYLREGTRNVSTLICRCMPAQVKRLIATRTFDLTPLDTVDGSAFLVSARTTPPSASVLWPGDERVESRLDKCLRLPEGF